MTSFKLFIMAAAVGVSSLQAWTDAANTTLVTKDGLRLELSSTGRVISCRVSRTDLHLTEPGGFGLLDFAAETRGENLVTNPSFEEGARGWSLAPTQQLDNEIVHSGKASVRLHVPGPKPDSSNLGVRVPVKENTFYRVGVWMRRQNCGVCSAYFSEYDSQGKFSGGVTQVGLGAPNHDGEWTFQGKVIRTAPNTTSLLLRADIYRSTGMLWLDDFTIVEVGKSRFRPMSGAVRKKGDAVVFDSDVPDAKLKLRATWRSHPEYIQADGEVEDTSGNDRAIGVSFRLPFDAEGWTWWDDITDHRTIHEPGNYFFTYSCESGEGVCSVYPFAALTNSSAALSWALPLSQGPRVFLTGYDNNEKAAFLTFYLGLSRDTAIFPQKALFSFILYPSNPKWGLRSAVERYYRFFPESFVKRPTYEGYLNYADLEQVDPTTHVLSGGPSGGPRGLHAEDASDFGEGYRFLWHIHGCYDFRMLHIEDPKMPSDATVLQFLRDLAAKEDPKKAWYVPNAETLKKLTYDADGHIRYIGDTQFWQPHQGYNSTDKPGWGLNFRVNEDPGVSPYLANKTKEVLEKYAADPNRRDWSACLTADAIEGYFGNTDGLNYRREHFRSVTFPLTFGRDSLKVAMPNTIWDFHSSVWWPLTQKHHVVTYGNANGYEQTFTLPFCDIPMIEWDWDTARPGRFERYLRTMANHKIWRFWRVCGKGEEDRESVLAHLRRGLAYDVFPSVWGVQVVAGNLEDYRALYRQYIPIMEDLSAAGWESVPYARTSDDAVIVERFGSLRTDDLHFTLRNYAATEKQVTLTLDLRDLGISADDATRLMARDLLTDKLISLRVAGETATIPVAMAANGSVALRLGTPLSLARYALRRVREGLDRVERLFASDLKEQHLVMIAEGKHTISSARSNEQSLLSTTESLQRLLDRLDAAMTTKAPVDKEKVFYRIRRDLFDVTRSLVGFEIEAPRATEAIQGGSVGVPVTLINRGTDGLSSLSAAVHSPWDNAATESKVVSLPATLPPGVRASTALHLRIPPKSERRLLPFLIEVRASRGRVPLTTAALVDVQMVPALSIQPASDRLHLGRPEVLRLRVENKSDQKVDATLRLKPPADCMVDSGERRVTLQPRESREVECPVTFTDKAQPGLAEFVAEVQSDDARFQSSEKIAVKLLSPTPRAIVRRASQPPKIDGLLDDTVWQQPPTIPSLIELRSGKPVSENTACWLAYDDRGLYVAFRCSESDMPHTKAQMTQRGSPIYAEDDVEIFLLPSGAPGAVQLAVNPLGTQNDNIGNDKPWVAAAHRLQNEWTAEIFIPYSVLGVKSAPVLGAVWHAQVGRQQKPKSEVSAWTTSASGFNNADRFGELAFE